MEKAEQDFMIQNYVMVLICIYGVHRTWIYYSLWTIFNNKMVFGSFP